MAYDPLVYRAWAKTQKKYLADKSKRWRQQHPMWAKEVQKRCHAKLKDDIYARYGPVCVNCGFADRRALQIDHIAGGGTAHRKTFRNDYNYYRFVRDAPDGIFQILCANCNFIKRYENNELNQFEGRENSNS